jgi:hypothetical protein
VVEAEAEQRREVVLRAFLLDVDQAPLGPVVLRVRVRLHERQQVRHQLQRLCPPPGQARPCRAHTGGDEPDDERVEDMLIRQQSLLSSRRSSSSRSSSGS